MARHSHFGGVVQRPLMLGEGKRVQGLFQGSENAGGTLSRFGGRRAKAAGKSLRTKQRHADAASLGALAGTGAFREAMANSGVFAQEWVKGGASAPRSTRLTKTLAGVAKQFMEDCYAPLMGSIVMDFRRESTRLLPSDHINFMHVLAFCTTFYRMHQDKLHKEKPGTHFKWGPLFQTMDLWSFHFVIKSCQKYHETKQVRRPPEKYHGISRDIVYIVSCSVCIRCRDSHVHCTLAFCSPLLRPDTVTP